MSSDEEFWDWVRATKSALLRRVQELSESTLPAARAREALEQLREYAVRPFDEDFEREIIDRALPAATQEIDEARDAAERELQYFLHGPIALSREGKPKFKTGVEGMKRSRPRPTARDAWENRFLNVLILDAVNLLHAYYETPEDEPLPDTIDPASIPIHEEATLRGLRRMAAVAGLVLLILRNGEITRDRLTDASRQAYELINESPTWEVDARLHDWGKERIRAFDVVGEVLDMNRAAVEKAFGVWRDAP